MFGSTAGADNRRTETLAHKPVGGRPRFLPHILTGLLSLAVLVAGVVAPSQGAWAAEHDLCWNGSLRVHWEGVWNANEKSWTMAGFEVWEWDVDTYGGAQPVAISESSGAKPVYVAWNDMGSASWGYGVCSAVGGNIYFSFQKKQLLNDHPTWLRALAAHEMGHAIGLGHVGKQDSYDGDNPPVMWACNGGTDVWRPTQDDHAAIQLQTDPSGGYRSATANSSFEEDTGLKPDVPDYLEFWYVSSGAGTWRFSGGVDGTPYYMAFGRTGGSSYIFSTTALTDSPTIDWVKARANYRKFEPDDYGNVKVMLRVRPYESGGSGCGNPERRDGAHSYGSALYYTKYCTPGLGWGYCTTYGQNPPLKNAKTGGIEVRVYVYNYMKSGNGAYRSVGVDRVRVLANY